MYYTFVFFVFSDLKCTFGAYNLLFNVMFMKSISTVLFILFSVFTLTAQHDNTPDNSYSPPENISMFQVDGLLLKPEAFLKLNIGARSIEKINVDKNFTYREDDILYVGKINVKTSLQVVLDNEKLDDPKTKYKKLSALTEKKIASINLLSEKVSREKYGAKNRDQVLLIETKK